MYLCILGATRRPVGRLPYQFHRLLKHTQALWGFQPKCLVNGKDKPVCHGWDTSIQTGKCHASQPQSLTPHNLFMHRQSSMKRSLFRPAIRSLPFLRAATTTCRRSLLAGSYIKGPTEVGADQSPMIGDVGQQTAEIHGNSHLC